MKINIITYNNGYGLTQDLNLLVFYLKKHFRTDVEVYAVNFFDYKCNYADLNIFLETVSLTLMKYAPINILVPNQEWYYRTWVPYIHMFDKILVKSNYAENIFKELVGKSNENKIVNIGWLSNDRNNPDTEKDFTKCVHICGKSTHKQTQLIVDSWDADFPEITILYSPKDVKIVPKEQTNIKYVTERLSDKDLNVLMNESGIHICCSEAEGFGHYIQEAKSCRSVVITLDAPPMNNFITSDIGFLVDYRQKKQLKDVLGSKYIMDCNDFKKTMRTIIKQSKDDYKVLRRMGERSRESYLKTCNVFKEKMPEIFRDIFEQVANIIKVNEGKKEENEARIKSMMKDENLPHVTIITPTFNRPHMFKVAVCNYMNFNYPRDKLQWVIVDDGDHDLKVNELLPEGENIKYISIDKQVPIGVKRNICVENSDNDIIVCMDDDDFYPVNSVKIRVLELLRSKKQCVTCTTIACFHINKLISMVNVPPHKLAFSERISEATLTFYKSFWEKQKFPSTSIGEADGFLSGRVNDCLEVSWEGIIVSLLHNRNVSGKITIGDVPNGCHYGWDDELFLFITNLDREITEEEENRIKEVRNGKFVYDPNYTVMVVKV